MLVDNGLSACVQKWGEAKLNESRGQLISFFRGVEMASPEDLADVYFYDIPALIDTLNNALKNYTQAFTKAGSPYAQKTDNASMELQELAFQTRGLFAKLANREQRQSPPLYTKKTSQFLDMMTANATQLPTQLIPNITHVVGDYSSDIYKGLMWASDMHLTNLPKNATAIRQTVVRFEGYFALKLSSVLRTLKA